MSLYCSEYVVEHVECRVRVGVSGATRNGYFSRGRLDSTLTSLHHEILKSPSTENKSTVDAHMVVMSSHWCLQVGVSDSAIGPHLSSQTGSLGG